MSALTDLIKLSQRTGKLIMNIEFAESLDEIAAGKKWSECALRAAINEPYLSDAEKAVLWRYLNGSHTGVDHVTLQDIARAIRNNREA